MHPTAAGMHAVLLVLPVLLLLVMGSTVAQD
jgi:hypothetical protein